ncbi:MAG: adenosylmethionine--8-amino-7-oxononanoate transaminase [Gammaproteobacteria bacterium]|nr:adenosylmethionine--8-amino-7-oxononanoate transaminase [Gammaproteobacteria bacterium]MDH3506016.1 adenosylmethionine--8-amino-7-oxononanoate transaminase [Gammaproteobacteria bacterium]
MARENLWLPYRQAQTAPAPQVATRTEGARIILEDGRSLVDGISSWWTACHGYNHPVIAAAVSAQLAQMPHVMLGGLVHEQACQLGGRLAAALPGELEHVFFSESGSVAVEVGMKIAVQYWLNRGVSGRTRFLSFRHGYHGDTFAAMSVCDPEEGMHRLFGELVAGQLIVDLPRNSTELTEFDKTLERHRDELAGVILEPLVQAAGGMKFHSPEMLAAIAETVSKHGVLLLLDEIATGFGRTGSLFACEQAGVTPDVIMLSKALTGGTLPLAATVASERVHSVFLSDTYEHALMHGPTFAGNALACAAANASLTLFETEPRLEQVAAIEERLTEGLAPCSGLAHVADVRVKGAIGVVQLDRVPDLDALRQAFLDEHVWIRPFHDVVYLMPPFVISEDELETLMRAVCRVVERWSRAPS